ncbi:hypothetical protein TEA_005770 [Camellia sinensis var. sinensis]|uniref:Uncharacterized protein n=1 Tax=Camellia sinensis var. sinensis TaxID=542762 RepID=A0A4S4EGP8_CAMSN|nr:hypothetical protein TEA_005770 [Camellia sinensis var. sinensis]
MLYLSFVLGISMVEKRAEVRYNIHGNAPDDQNGTLTIPRDVKITASDPGQADIHQIAAMRVNHIGISMVEKRAEVRYNIHGNAPDDQNGTLTIPRDVKITASDPGQADIHQIAAMRVNHIALAAAVAVALAMTCLELVASNATTHVQ